MADNLNILEFCAGEAVPPPILSKNGSNIFLSCKLNVSGHWLLKISLQIERWFKWTLAPILIRDIGWVASRRPNCYSGLKSSLFYSHLNDCFNL